MALTISDYLIRQIPADCNPEVYDKGFCSRTDGWAGQFGLADPPPSCRHPVPGTG
jgi:hypothetical protein